MQRMPWNRITTVLASLLGASALAAPPSLADGYRLRFVPSHEIQEGIVYCRIGESNVVVGEPGEFWLAWVVDSNMPGASFDQVAAVAWPSTGLDALEYSLAPGFVESVCSNHPCLIQKANGCAPPATVVLNQRYAKTSHFEESEYIEGGPHPTYGAFVRDCTFGTIPLSAICPVFVNNEPAPCDCFGSVDTKKDTWGRIRAMF